MGKKKQPKKQKQPEQQQNEQDPEKRIKTQTGNSECLQDLIGQLGNFKVDPKDNMDEIKTQKDNIQILKEIVSSISKQLSEVKKEKQKEEILEYIESVQDTITEQELLQLFKDNLAEKQIKNTNNCDHGDGEYQDIETHFFSPWFPLGSQLVQEANMDYNAFENEEECFGSAQLFFESEDEVIVLYQYQNQRYEYGDDDEEVLGKKEQYENINRFLQEILGIKQENFKKLNFPNLIELFASFADKKANKGLQYDLT